MMLELRPATMEAAMADQYSAMAVEPKLGMMEAVMTDQYSRYGSQAKTHYSGSHHCKLILPL